MVGISGRRWAVRYGGFAFPDVGSVASLCRYDCLGSVLQGRHTITREEYYVFHLQCAQPGVVRRVQRGPRWESYVARFLRLAEEA